jgi:hypothetical protein
MRLKMSLSGLKYRTSDRVSLLARLGPHDRSHAAHQSKSITRPLGHKGR